MNLTQNLSLRRHFALLALTGTAVVALYLRSGGGTEEHLETLTAFEKVRMSYARFLQRTLQTATHVEQRYDGITQAQSEFQDAGEALGQRLDQQLGRAVRAPLADFDAWRTEVRGLCENLKNEHRSLRGSLDNLSSHRGGALAARTQLPRDFDLLLERVRDDVVYYNADLDERDLAQSHALLKKIENDPRAARGPASVQRMLREMDNVLAMKPRFGVTLKRLTDEAGWSHLGRLQNEYYRSYIAARSRDDRFLMMSLALSLLLVAQVLYVLYRLYASNEELHGLARGLEERVEDRTRVIAAQQERIAASTRLASLGEMASGIAHEINNPLAVIHLCSDEIEEEVAANHEINRDKLRKLNEKILRTSQRMARIVRGLKMLARKDLEGEAPSRIGVQGLFEDTLELYRRKFAEDRVAFEVPAFDPLTTVLGRPAEVGQVLVNLLNNARDAVQEVPDKWIRLEVRRAGDHVELIVTDSGAGVPEAIAEKIMEPFFTTKAPGHGTGLGLSISHSIARAQGGDLLLDRKSPSTRFVFSLPAAKSA